MPYSFDGSAKLVVLTAGTTEFSVADMWSRYVDWVAAGNQQYIPAMRVVGGDSISATKKLGATFFMINGWRIRPQEADHRLVVNGNLYTDPAGSSPFVSTVGSFNVAIEMQVSNLSDSTVAALPELDKIKFQVESLFTSHQGFGQSFYVSTAGNDANSGTSSFAPKRTIAAAYALCVAGRGDVIFLLTPDASVGTFYENVILNKEDTHIRGAGRGVAIQPAAGVGVTVFADNCELTGMQVRSPSGSLVDNIQIYGKFPKLRGLYVVGADTGAVSPVGNGHGVHFMAGDYGIMEDCVIEKCGGSGVMFTDTVHANGAPREVVFRRNKIYYNRRYGIELTGVSANSTRLNWIDTDNAITHNSLGGVYAGPNTQRNVIRSSNLIKDNATYPSGAGGDQYEIVDDGSTDFMVELTPSHVPRAVWSEALEGMSAEEMLRVMLAALAGKSSGVGTATEQYLSHNGLKPRIIATFDGNSNRTGITLDGTP